MSTFSGPDHVVLSIGYYVYLRKLTTLRLTRRHEGGFWRRNSEKVVLLVIGALIGALLGGIATYAVTVLTKTR